MPFAIAAGGASSCAVASSRWSSGPAARHGKRNNAIDIARGAAVLLVVFMHCCLIVQQHISANFIALNWAVAAVRMPVLFLVSGFLVSKYVAGERGGTILTRSMSLLWVYLAWTALESLLRGAVSLRDVLLPASPLWFLLSLAMLTGALIVVRRCHPAAVFAVAVIVSLIVFAKLEHWPPVIEKTGRYAVFFVAGVFAPACVTASIRPPRLAITAAALVLLLATHLADALLVRHYGWQVLGLVERTIAAALFLNLAATVARVTWLARPLVLIGRNTLPIFVAHWQVAMLGAPVAVAVCPGYALPFVLAGWAVGASLGIYILARYTPFALMYRRPRASDAAVARRWLAGVSRVLASAAMMLAWIMLRGIVGMYTRAAYPIHAFSMWRGRVPGASRITSTRMSSPTPT